MPLSRYAVRFAICASLSSTLLVASAAVAQVSVTTNHNDLARTGANLAETTLNTTNVNVAQFGKLFERVVDDEIYGQPLYVAGVAVPGHGIRNVVYVATVSNSVYAFDADDPAASAPLWRNTYINPPQVVPVHRTDVGQTCGTYLDFAGNIGIVGTPVIDPATQTIYFVARTKESGTFVQRLHAVDIRDGSARPGSPVVIDANVPGTGSGSVGGVVPFDKRTHNQRAGLMLLNGVVYIAWASHCDQGPYHGWIMGYDAASLQQVMVYNSTPNGREGGIWQSGQALSADAGGNIYALTGNGTVDINGGPNRGSSFIKLAPNGTLVDWFTPHNWEFLNQIDGDLIQGGLLVPDSNLIIGGGKQGRLYVLDRNNLGHLANNDNQIVQSFQASSSGRMNGSPVYWNSPAHGPVIYLWPASDPLKAFRLSGGLFDTVPVGQSTALAASGMPGGMLSLSAFGSTAGTGILWAAISRVGDANNQTQPGILRAYDANDVTRELWNSEQDAARDRLTTFSKFSPPTIANGKVFVPTFSNKLVAYGLLSGEPQNAPPTVNAGPDRTVTLPATLPLTATAADDGIPNPPGALTISWSKVTGPGTVVFAPVNALVTSASFSAPGQYLLRVSASDGAIVVSDELSVAVYPVPGSGSGLRGQYFNDPGDGTHFIASVLTRIDPAIDFDWANGPPAAGVQADNFSVRWTGQVQAAVTGDVVFGARSNDGVRLWINDELVLDNWTDDSPGTDLTSPLALVENVTYNVRLEMYDHVGPAVAQLLWSYGGQSLTPIPQGRLFPGPAPNTAPIANAGSDQIISLPNTASLFGSGNDDGLPNPPGALTFRWSKISGREESEDPVVFGNPDSPATTVSFPAADVYVLRLTVSDGAITVSDDVVITVNPPPTGAGTGLLGQYYNDPSDDAPFTTLALTRIDPTVNFDWGLGAPGPGVQADDFSVRWTGFVQAVVTGDHVFSVSSDDGVRLWVNGALIIDNWVNQPETVVTSAPVPLQAGALNTIRMEFYDHVEDGIARLRWSYAGQPTTVIAQSQLYPPTGPPNAAPVAMAGADQTVTLPAPAVLAGAATDDGLPQPPGSLAVLWTKVSGPGIVSFGTPTALSTTAAFSQAGTYGLRLSVSDGSLSASDDLTVIVNPASNLAPVVNAGPDVAVTWPSAASLTATATDDGLPNPPGALAFQWSSVSGPGVVTFSAPTALTTGATFSVAGVYVLRLTASDGSLSSSDELTVTAATGSGSGTGLTGTYYNDPSNGALRFTTLVVTRLDPNVDFDWVRNAPAPGVQKDNFSVRWTGDVLAPVTGDFRFVTMSDDGVRLWINNQLVIDNWGNHPLTTNTSAPIPLTSGVRYPVRLEFWDGVKDAVIRLHWNYPGQATVAIPTARLFPVSGGTPNVAPTVGAGTDQTITLPAGATLTGTATDDGLPNPPGALTLTWSKVTGPGTVTFGTPNALQTTASFSLAGTYGLRLSAGDGSLTTSDDVTVTVLDGGGGPVGTGLTGRYYNDPLTGLGSQFTSLVLTRIDPTVDFDWLRLNPAPVVQRDFFSIRWTGTVLAPVTGQFRFVTMSDDGVRLWVNDQLVIDNWGHHAVTTNTSAPIPLQAGVRYSIRLEYWDGVKEAVMRLHWNYEGQATVPVPTAQLFPEGN
jgi:hypothetical protein